MSPTLREALKLLLRPVARFCLRHSYRIQEVVESAKAVLVDAARETLEREGVEVTASRLSVMTGLHRRDIQRLSRGENKAHQAQSLLIKVIGRWQTDRRFQKGGKPRVLPFGTEKSAFNQLVASVSKDLFPATVLFELERTGTVTRAEGGLLLNVRSFVPRGDPQALFAILADDLGDLSDSVNENILLNPQIPNLHVRTSYDRIRAGELEQIKCWLLREGHAFHAKVQQFLSSFDQDVNPDPGYKGHYAKISVTSFSKAGADNDK